MGSVDGTVIMSSCSTKQCVIFFCRWRPRSCWVLEGKQHTEREDEVGICAQSGKRKIKAEIFTHNEETVLLVWRWGGQAAISSAESIPRLWSSYKPPVCPQIGLEWAIQTSGYPKSCGSTLKSNLPRVPVPNHCPPHTDTSAANPQPSSPSPKDKIRFLHPEFHQH